MRRNRIFDGYRIGGRILDGRTAHWVAPTLVCEVAFTEWTEDDRIRHPSFQGLRTDKKPCKVARERP